LSFDEVLKVNSPESFQIQSFLDTIGHLLRQHLGSGTVCRLTLG